MEKFPPSEFATKEKNGHGLNAEKMANLTVAIKQAHEMGNLRASRREGVKLPWKQPCIIYMA